MGKDGLGLEATVAATKAVPTESGGWIGAMATDTRVQLLTKRELELLHHVFLGRRTAEIAGIEGIATQTVLNRLQDARGKLGGVDRRTAALIVAEAKGWVPGIKPTDPKNTLSPNAVTHSFDSADGGERRVFAGSEQLQREGGVFINTLTSEWPARGPQRRNEHDALTRVSMLIARTALLVAATVALLWVYGRV